MIEASALILFVAGIVIAVGAYIFDTEGAPGQNIDDETIAEEWKNLYLSRTK